MARSKSNTETRFHAALRFELLLDEYVAASPENALPEQWGATPSWRRYYAACLARFSQSPDLLKITSANISPAEGSRRDLSRQILFAELFAVAPNYFLAFVAHFRRTITAKSQIELVASKILSEGDRLLIASDGCARSDKEIARMLERRKDFHLIKLHPSVVGKARKLIAFWSEREQSNRINRHLDETPSILEGLDQIRSLTETADKFSA